MNNKKEQSQQIKNELLKLVFTTKSHLQIIFIFSEFIVLTIAFCFIQNNCCVSLDTIININLAIFGINLALLIFIVQFLVNDKNKYLKCQRKLCELITLRETNQSRIKELKEIDARIFLDSKVLNFLYLNTLLLITTFCSTLFSLIFVNNKTLTLAINSSHIIVEISYILTSVLILGPCIRTNNLTQMYNNMLDKEKETAHINRQLTCKQ